MDKKQHDPMSDVHYQQQYSSTYTKILRVTTSDGRSMIGYLSWRNVHLWFQYECT